MMKILFVCTGNVDRSKTAEEMFKNVKDVEVRSAGTSIAATVPLSRELIDGQAELKRLLIERLHAYM